uniref:Ras association domain family member 4 n=1 Tax=Petromyzon marinus TaxID=7757 RepID=S4RME9_PETMA
MGDDLVGCDDSTRLCIGEGKIISKSDLMAQLRIYNCYHEGKTLQLRYREDDGQLIIEGLLNIAWGLRRPIRLQLHDDNERIHIPSPPEAKDPGKLPKRRNRNQTKQYVKSLQPIFNIVSNTDDSLPVEKELEFEPRLPRTKSDASCFLRHSVNRRSAADMQRLRRNRFSINGHYYNHKTSVFTPTYGSVTSVRVSSNMTSPEVVSSLLYKFRVENNSSDFALYIVRATGEKRRLKVSEFPLITRILHGPSEKIARLFLMEEDLGEEVTHDVAQYIQFEMPVLESFVSKLKEEEVREENKLKRKFDALRSVIEQRLQELLEAG